GVGDISDDFLLRMVYRVDLCRDEIDVDDLQVVAPHEERGLLDHVMADVDDQVGGVDGAVHEVVRGERGIAHVQRIMLVQYALAHLGRKEGNPGLVYELAQHLGGQFPVRGRTNENEGALCIFDHIDRGANGFDFGDGPAELACG